MPDQGFSLRITNLPRNRTFILKGLTAIPPNRVVFVSPVFVVVEACKGRVHLEQIEAKLFNRPTRLFSGQGNLLPVEAFQGAGGQLEYDPRVVFVPNGNRNIAPAIPARAFRRGAIINADADAPGGRLRFDLLANDGDLAEIWLSGVGSPFRLPNFGVFWVDPASLLVLGRVAVGPSERVAVSVPIPIVPGLRGLPVVVQAIAGTANGLRLTTAATVILD